MAIIAMSSVRPTDLQLCIADAPRGLERTSRRGQNLNPESVRWAQLAPYERAELALALEPFLPVPFLPAKRAGIAS